MTEFIKNLDDLFGSSPDRQLKLSYSRVSDFDRNGPKCLIKRTFVENDGAKIGSITDDLLYTKLVDKNYFRPTEVDMLIGDASKAKNKLG